MEFEWLAAIAYPRAIAVHPNFPSADIVTAPEKLAAEVLVESRYGSGRGEGGGSGDDYAFADICIAALRDGDASYLLQLEQAISDEALDLGKRACAGILALSISLESGLPRRDLLEDLLRATSSLSDSAGRLANLWMQLGSAVLGLRYGENQYAAIHELRKLLDELATALPDIDFRTTRGLELSAATVFGRILDLLAHAALTLEMSLQGLGGDLWAQGLRRPKPVLLAALESKMADGYSGWTKRGFIELTRRGTKFLGGSALPGDDSMAIPGRVSGFVFHPYARHAALELGRARFLRGQQLEPGALRTWLIESSLTLMRFSQDRETAQSAVRYTLQHGPLKALAADLNQVVTTVSTRGSASHLEIEYLYEAATMLSRGEARMLFDKLSDEFAGIREPLREQWTVPWARRESLGKLLGRLTGPGEVKRRFIELLASQVADEGNDDRDRLISMALQAAGPTISETDAGPLLVRLGGESGYPTLRAVLASQLKIPMALLSGYIESERSPMDEAIEYVDRLIRENSAPVPSETAKHAGSIEDTLREMQNAADRGLHAMGVVEPLDVAVAYAITARWAQLWPLIIEVIKDPRVDRSQKNAALDRLARSVALVPSDVRSRLEASMTELLALPGSPLDDERTPYPAALRTAAALGTISQASLMPMLGPWLSSADASDRVSAVSVLVAIPAKPVPVWVIQSLVAATFDNDAEVQADAMQALAHLYPRAGAMQDLVFDRANDLLASDGTLLQRKVLAELATTSGRELRERLSGRVHALTRHMDWRVRLEANAVASASSA